MAVCEDTGQPIQIKALAIADCSPIEIIRHLQKKERTKNVYKAHITSHTTNLPVWVLQGSNKIGYSRLEESFIL